MRLSSHTLVEWFPFWVLPALLGVAAVLGQVCPNSLPQPAPSELSYAVMDGLVVDPHTACRVRVYGDPELYGLLRRETDAAHPLVDGWILGCGDALLVNKAVAGNVLVEFMSPVCLSREAQLPPVYVTECGVSVNDPSYVDGAVLLTVVGGADFNGDGDWGTDQDIEDFFACLARAGCPGADFDRDGDAATDADIATFFEVLGGR